MYETEGGGFPWVARWPKVPAYEIAKRIMERHDFAKDANGRLYRYLSGVYLDDGEEFAKRMCKEVLAEAELLESWSSHKAAEVAEFIRVDARPLLQRPDRNRLTVANGILHLDTMELMPHRPSYAVTVRLPIVYDPKAKCPSWLRFAQDWFGEEGPTFVAETAAWLMTPDLSLQKALLLLGEGGEGKSRFLAGLRAFLDSSNVSAIALHQLEEDRFKAARLQGKLANFYADLPSTYLQSTSFFKSLVAGDAITGEQKFRESFDFQPFARLVFSANTPPRSADASSAFFSRWIVVRFKRRFRDEADQVSPQEIDRLLADPTERAGLLNLALAALPRLRERGFTITAAMQEAYNEFVEATDPFTVWLNARTVEDPEAFTPCSELMAAYRDYALEHSLGVSVTRVAIGNALRRARPRVRYAQKAVAGKTMWSYIGIMLRKESHDSRNSRTSRTFPNSSQSREETKRQRNGEESVNSVSPVTSTPSPLVAEALQQGGRVV